MLSVEEYEMRQNRRIQMWRGLCVWLSAALVTMLVGLVFIVVYGNPLPWPDKGFRHYWVKDANAAAAAVEIAQLGGLKLRRVVKVGATHQAWMWDGTVFLWLDESDPTLNGWSGNGPSLVVDDPQAATTKASHILLKYNIMPVERMMLQGTKKPGDLYLFRAENNFLDWVFVFRLWGPKMGMPEEDAPLPFRK